MVAIRTIDAHLVKLSHEAARFIADLLQKRVGVTPEIVVSDIDGASKCINAFAASRDPWIVAVHMISGGVDIPRLRVGVFASNVVTEMYFRQFCGRFVCTTSDSADCEAYLYVPDDHRIGTWPRRLRSTCVQR